jgi:16S rRNA (guanine966-N2)-methyltransferase
MGGINILRVISGMAKGHKLKTLKGNSTRPTSDRVKESLFNIISPYIMDNDVLDLFAGTGSLGIEALSRGARFAAFVDKSTACASVIKENLEHTKFLDKSLVITGEVESSLLRLSREGRKFGIIFVDPPYNKEFIGQTLNSILQNNIMKPDGIVVAERDIEDEIPEEMGSLKLVRNQKYGDTILSFYKFEE